MISRSDLKKVARGRLQDAEILLHRRRYDGAIYLCGYAVEIALKARICQTLNWPDFPSTRGEFENLSSFRTHKLDVLLHLSGREEAIKIKARLLKEWSAVAKWEPEFRYRPMGSAKRADALEMINSTKAIMGQL